MRVDHTTIDDPVQAVLSRLKSVKPTGESSWEACCPSHNDRAPSLSVSRGEDGRALVFCHAGCAPDDICSAIGLKLSDLFPSNGSAKPATRSKPATPEAAAFPTIEAYVNSLGDRCGGHWTYVDASGNPVLYTVRLEKPDGKDFMQLHPVAGGIAFGGIKGKSPLWNLPALVDVETVYVAEGEKAAAMLETIGFHPATTWAGGCNAVDKTDWTPTADKNLVIFTDNDCGGEKAGVRIATITSGLQPPARVKIIRLPGLPDGGDICDFADALDSKEDADIKRGIDELIASASWFVPTPDTESAKPKAKRGTTPKELAEIHAGRLRRARTGEWKTYEPPADEVAKLGAWAQTKRMTELVMAERVVGWFGAEIRYTKQLGWLHWTGVRWERDDTNAVIRLAKQAVRRLYQVAGQITDDGARDALVDWARKCESRARLDAIVTLAMSEAGVAVRMEDFDRDPWLFNTLTGTIDLRTGELKPHDSRDLITKLSPVTYDPNAKCPRFDRF
ncbi:MAG: hypothetical protein Q7R41_01825, partial [Phycisphaerales bacterium]|nr:hypothetical protein [Phycisphaerales bacterium]